MMFSDPGKPIATCIAESCWDCAVNGKLHCHFSLKDWLYFLFIAFPPFLLGGAGIYHVGGWWLLPWILFSVAFFGFIEIRVMCAHCPHYAESATSLKCWANYGSPKLWKYRPGPMTLTEKVFFFVGFAMVWGYPLLFLLAGKQLFLLLVYSMTAIGFFLTLTSFMCSQCMNFACPLNGVDEERRSAFFEKNPVVAQAWRESGDMRFD